MALPLKSGFLFHALEWLGINASKLAQGVVMQQVTVKATVVVQPRFQHHKAFGGGAIQMCLVLMLLITCVFRNAVIILKIINENFIVSTSV